MKRILVCGGRDYADRAMAFRVLDLALQTHGRFVLVQGGADGADAIAAEWARSRCVPYWTFPADWSRHKRSAGHIRNREMLEVSTPVKVIAFPGGRGTTNMTQQAEAAHIPVLFIPKRSQAALPALPEFTTEKPE